jgi:predicted ATPase/class 3 adenylate cyclase
MPDLLTGTVTFLFTDIEGSTLLVRSEGDAWPALLERHRALLRAAFEANDGSEVGTEGDSFFVAFPSAPAGVAAAVDAQRALAAEPWPPDAAIRVRMGMHTGEATFSAKTYAGLHVHRASRIAGLAHGGQVLVSGATRALLGDLPEGVDLRDLGAHRLKDIELPEHIWQLVIAGLRSDFPAIRSLEATPNNLPTSLTTFLGREREIGEVSELLGHARLLTLTGPGGTGKTRLSLAVAARALDTFVDGVYFVELSTITDPDLVLPTVAMALNLPDLGRRTPLERLADHIGDQRVLVVLDNFEQVVDAAASVNELLTACPRLAIVVSSRVVLRVSGEQEYLVPPLGLPDPQRLPPFAQLSQYESVALFIERARAVKPGFEVTNDNAPAVAEICVRLDGLPLAIELAAARVRILTPQAMLSRLADRLGLLSGGSRDLPARQQTLRGAIAWSYDMLDERERSLFSDLSVFVGGASLESIERVCAAEMAGDGVEVLASLVEKSLVRQGEGVGGQPRFTMLETIREFASEQAAEHGRLDELRTTHAAAFLELAETAGPLVMSAEKRHWLDRLEEDHDNLRAAMSWALQQGDAPTALRIGARLWRFWQMRGYLAEGVERLQAALALPSGHDHPELRADALDAAAGIAYWMADAVRSRDWYREEIETRRSLGDRGGLAGALYGLSFTWSVLDLEVEEFAEASKVAIDEALAIYTELGDEGGVGRCEWALANRAYGLGELAAATEHSTHAREVFERIGDSFMVGWATFTLALGALAQDRESGSTRPDLRADAERWLYEVLEIFAEAQDVSGYTLVLDTLTLVAYHAGDLERAARLNGAVRSLERATGTGLNWWNRSLLDFPPEDAFGAPELAAIVAEGETMTPEEAVAYALSR